MWEQYKHTNTLDNYKKHDTYTIYIHIYKLHLIDKYISIYKL